MVRAEGRRGWVMLGDNRIGLFFVFVGLDIIVCFLGFFRVFVGEIRY